MIRKIKAGKHRAWPPWLGLFFNRTVFRHVITFQVGCDYWISGPDMMDTNKLYGVGYLWNHHKDSARFGWRYDNGNKIIISAYCYVNGERIIQDICKVPMYKPLMFDILVLDNPNFYIFTVMDGETVLGNTKIPFNHKKKWSFPLGLYFGGNKPAPKTVEISFKKP